MKKYILSFGLIIVFAFYALFASSKSDEAVSTTDTPTPSQSTPPTKASAPVNPTLAKYKDGTYTGAATDAYFGTVQVKATVSDGRLSDVAFIQYPNDRSTSIRISDKSMPVLKSEAIQAQSAKIDIVSGATQTSQAFMQSLDSALAQASN